MTENRVIRWTDNGPVKNFVLEVPDEGLIVFEGPPGSGKSTMLQSLDDALDDTRKSRIPIRDGAPRAEVEIFGQAVLRRSTQTRRIGHLEVATLAGKFNISDLIEPRVDKQDAREAIRIKAILQLTGAQADPAAFYPLVGSQSEFDEIVSSDSLAASDIVEMAAQIKAAFELEARQLEKKASTLRGQAEAARLSANGTNVDEPHDAKELSQAYDDAIRTQSRLQAEAEAYEDAKARRDQSQEALTKLEREYTGLGRPEAFELAQEAKNKYLATQEEVIRLREELRQAETRMAAELAASELADQSLKTAQAHANACAALATIVKTKLPEPVMQLDLDEAETAVKTALGAVERGAVIRKAREDLQKASDLKSDANTAESRAAVLREAAKATDTILAEAIQSIDLPLTVSEGRLVFTESDRNQEGTELFEELSKGEKTRLVARIAIKAVGPSGMFTIPQEFFEGLVESDIIALAQELENTGVLAITARAVDSDTITAKQVEGFSLK